MNTKLQKLLDTLLKIIIVILLIPIFINYYSGNGANSNGNRNLASITNEISPSVFMIIKKPISKNSTPNMANIYVDSDGEKWTKGTAFAITEDGYLLTASHVIEGSSELYAVQFDEHGKEKKIPINNYRKTGFQDLAILDIATATKPVIITKEKNKISVGSKIGFLGFSYPNKNELILHDGIISNSSLKTDYLGMPGEYKIHSFVNYGNSGGPVFLAEKNEVIGFVIARETASQMNQLSLININQNDPNKILLEIQNRQNQIYNLLAGEISRTTQMGIGIVVGINKEVVNTIVENFNNSK